MQAPPDGSSGGVRGGLAAWLREQRPVPPIRDGASKADSCGFVEAPFDRGLVDLVSGSGDRPGVELRLAWGKEDRARTRPVPPGTWLVRHYVIEREQGGRDWILSCTGSDGPSIVVRAGETVKMAIDPTVRIGWSVRRAKGALALALAVGGHGGMEASLMDTGRREIDRRVPADFELISRDGARVAAGPLAYG